MMPRWCFVTAFSIAAHAPMTRWCRRLAAASKILPKAAWPPAPPKKTELKLIGVAQARLEELLLDFQDYLCQQGFSLWGKEHPKAREVRKFAFKKNKSYTTYRTYLEASPPEIAANTMICLIHQTNYLLDQQLRALEKEFLEEGGFTERLYRTRTQIRNRNRNR